jgi:nitrogen regulatory protein PII/signal recognition particle receptor subunit beta
VKELEKESPSNVKKIIALSNYNSTQDHSEDLLKYFNENIKDEMIQLSVFNYRNLLIDDGKNYLLNIPGHNEFRSIKQVLSEEVDGVIFLIETVVGIFETDLEMIKLISAENIPHVLFSNRNDFSEFEMETHVDGVLIIPTIIQEGIGINDGLKMLLKLIDKQEQEFTPITNNSQKNKEKQENYESYEEYDNLEDPSSFETEFYKLRFFFHPIELDNIKNSLAEFGFSSITIIDIKYHDVSNKKMETYRASSYELELPPKIEVMMIIKKEEIQYVINALESVKTEDISEKVFISPVEDVLRISTNEKGENAID